MIKKNPQDTVVAKVNAAGSALVYCGYIGGSASDYASGIAVDGAGQAYVTGNVSSTQAQGFPVLAGPDLTHNGGGSDAFVVLVDADLRHAAAQAALARTINNGQSCIAAKRFIVEEPLAARFEEALVAAMAALRVGDPMDRATQVGPLARPDLVDELEGQVRRSVAAGAALRLGGRRREGPGCYFPPTVLTGVEPGMAAFDEETFGPLAAVTRARDAEHALELANRSRYGLGGSVWTADVARGRELARRLEAGAVFVNETVKSDPRVPFGGVKCSGHGRELAAFGLREFVNVRTVWVR